MQTVPYSNTAVQSGEGKHRLRHVRRRIFAVPRAELQNRRLRRLQLLHREQVRLWLHPDRQQQLRLRAVASEFHARHYRKRPMEFVPDRPSTACVALMDRLTLTADAAYLPLRRISWHSTITCCEPMSRQHDLHGDRLPDRACSSRPSAGLCGDEFLQRRCGRPLLGDVGDRWLFQRVRLRDALSDIAGPNRTLRRVPAGVVQAERNQIAGLARGHLASRHRSPLGMKTRDGGLKSAARYRRLDRSFAPHAALTIPASRCFSRGITSCFNSVSE